MANPLATILSAAMMLRYSLDQEAAAHRVEAAVRKVLAQGLRTADIAAPGADGDRHARDGRRGGRGAGLRTWNRTFESDAA